MRARALLLAMLGLGCSSGTGFVYEPARAELLRETVDRVILPGYRAVETNATELHARTVALCAAPDAAGVEASRAAWRDLFLAWERTEAAQFGPTRDLNLGAELAFFPTRPDTIEATIASDAPLDDASVDALGAAGLGIFALEYLLYATPDATELAGALTPRRCDYLVAVAADAMRLSARIVVAWTPYGESLATAATAGNTTFPSQLRAISTLFTQLLASVTLIKSARLGLPLGDGAAGVPQPTEVRSRYAGLSNEGMLAELDGVRAVWTAGVDGRGLGGYLAMRNATLADTVLAQMTSTRTALASLPEPLETYVTRPEHLLATEAQLEARTLERTLGTEVSTALSISVMFTDADGD